MRIVAIVPMREHSVRVPFKNRRAFAGQPLYRWIVDALAACPSISEIIVDTDSPTILADHIDGVRMLERPEHLRADTLPMNDVLVNTTAQVAADFYLQTHSTNPLLRTETIQLAIDEMLASYPAHDSLFSVTRRHTRLWDAAGKPMNHDPAVLLRTQDLPPVFEENSCLYMFTRQQLVERGNRIGACPLMFEIDPIEAQDIDDEHEFRIAELLMLDRKAAR
ncbi:MAG: cytidylyltransferase domain-containing protein [Kofleriaceae bacterium]